jgi:Trypsin-like peptidase domain
MQRVRLKLIERSGKTNKTNMAEYRTLRQWLHSRLREKSFPVFCFGSLMVFGHLLQAPPSPRLPKAIASQEWRILKLAEREQDGFHFVGTGFALVRKEKAFVITNAHVLEKIKHLTELYADFGPPGNAHSMIVLSKDVTDDIAVLATDAEIQGDTEERIGVPKRTAAVFIVGFDDGHTTRDNLNVESGSIEMVGIWVDEKRLFYPSAQYLGAGAPAMLISGVTCRQGGSGSPVFGSDGEILGVVKGFTGDGKCLAISIPPALRLLEKYVP